MNLTKHFQPEGLSMIPIKMYLQTLQELTKMREKRREEEAPVAVPAAKKRCAANTTAPVAVTPCYSACSTTTQGPSPGKCATYQRVIASYCKKKDSGV